MEEPERNQNQQWLEEIPEDFYFSDRTEFRCIQCEEELLDSDKTYLVERSFKRVNESIEHVLFEYAVCSDCAQEMNSSISKESMLAIQAFMAPFFSPLAMLKRAQAIMEDKDHWKKFCLVDRTPKEELTDYNLCGLFQGNRMIVGSFPYLLGGRAMEELQQQLSQSTKDEMDRFKEKITGGPPELEEILKGRPVLLV